MNAVRNLLTSHDLDPRFRDSRDARARVASLYLPLVAIAIDNMGKLFSWTGEGDVRIVGSANNNEHLNLILTAISDNVPNVRDMHFHLFQSEIILFLFLQSKGPIILKEETTRHFLACVIWVLKNIDKTLLKQWWSELGSARLQIMLEILRICISCFQYKVGEDLCSFLVFKL